jgi:hypothetical protein
MIALDVIRRTLLITGAVAVMMLVIEYLNVQTRGALMRAIGTTPARQYLIAVLLGATPGCFGAFAVVALYTDRRVSLGAVAAAMIATSGDEMFVMLSLFPGTTLLMTLGLAVLGLAAGWLTDRLLAGGDPREKGCGGYSLHEQDECDCFTGRAIVAHWRRPRSHRLALIALTLAMAGAILAGVVGPLEWGTERVLLLALFTFGLFVLVTVPDHFLDEHLWKHVAREHVPRIFLWTLAALGAVAIVAHLVDVSSLVEENRWAVLGIASAVGIVPESGPHLVFVTLYDQGALPLSILVASSIVQDGHGMLPLLAHSRLDFLKVKAVNLAFGLAAGALMLLLGA